MQEKVLQLTPRSDSFLRKIPSTDWIMFLDDSRSIGNWQNHASLLFRQYKTKPCRSAYYHARKWLEVRERFLRDRSVKTDSKESAIVEPTISETISLSIAMQELKKQLSEIKQQQSFMYSELRSIGAARTDAFVMYMDMRNLNRVLRNSAFISDALSMTEDIPYPGKRKVHVTTIYEYLLRLEKKTQRRLDVFLRDGFQNRFDRKDLSDSELFMLRIRLLWGCGIVNELERDTQIPLSNDEATVLDVVRQGIDPDVLFVDLWANIGKNWLYNFADIIYKQGKLPTQYRQTAGIVRELKMLQQIKERRQ